MKPPELMVSTPFWFALVSGRPYGCLTLVDVHSTMEGFVVSCTANLGLRYPDVIRMQEAA